MPRHEHAVVATVEGQVEGLARLRRRRQSLVVAGVVVGGIRDLFRAASAQGHQDQYDQRLSHHASTSSCSRMWQWNMGKRLMMRTVSKGRTSTTSFPS